MRLPSFVSHNLLVTKDGKISTRGTLGHQLKQSGARGGGQDLESRACFMTDILAVPEVPLHLSHASLPCHDKEKSPSHTYCSLRHVQRGHFPHHYVVTWESPV